MKSGVRCALNEPTQVGNPAYGVETLRTDLANFAFLLGGNDGEHLLAPDTNPPDF